MKALPWTVRIYLSLIILGAGGIASWLLAAGGLPSGGQLPLAGLLALCMLLAWLYPLPVGFKTHFYLDTAVILAAVLLFEPATAMLICGTGALIAQFARRRYLDEMSFNTAQTMLQAAVAAYILYASGFEAGQVPASDPTFVVSMIVTGVALFVTSAVLVGTIVALQGGLNPLEVWFQSICKADDAVYVGHAVQIGLAIVIAVLGGVHPWTILLLVPPVGVVYFALDQGLELRRQISLALRLREKNLTEAQRLAQIGSWEWDLSSGAHGWSEEAFRILGYDTPYPRPTLDHLLDRIHPEDRDTVDGRIHAAIRYESSFDIEHRIVQPNKRERMVHHRGEVTRSESGNLRIVAMIHDITEQKSLEAQLEHMAYHDPLTGLLNRTRLVEELEVALEAWQRGGRAFALLFIDLDSFKQVNDKLGHRAGDAFLTEVGQRLESSVREGDVVARYGGDEFVVLARSVSHPEAAERLSMRCLESLEVVQATWRGQSIPMTASIGIVMPGSRLDSTDDLLQRVDAAMYRAKREGKNRFWMYRADAAGEPLTPVR